MRWVTEKRPHVDRCASAWFIRRFVDRRAKFLFVERGEKVPKGSTPYDLPSAPLGHHGEKVTFDALIVRHGKRDRGLSRLADLVRDIDLGVYHRAESRGIDTLLFGLLLVEPDDREILRLTRPIFEGLYQYYRGERER